MPEQHKFDFDMIIDDSDSFVTLVYDCKQQVISRDEDEAFVDNTATLIRATKLTSDSEKVWHYGDNRPNWLIKFFDGNAETIEQRIRERFAKEANKFFQSNS